MTDFNSHPQPRTFAPSKEDVLQNLQYFFGAPVSPEKLKDYSEHHAMTYHFPGAPLASTRRRLNPQPQSHGLTLTLALPLADAYAGQNTKIRDTLNNLILKSPQNWQTSVGLPFFQIEGTVVEWDE